MLIVNSKNSMTRYDCDGEIWQIDIKIV